MNKSGLLVVLSGPSGSGKDTVLERLAVPGSGVNVSISMTTRRRRDNELDGVNYYFVTRDYFEKKIAEQKVLEFAEYAGNYYGTPKEPVDVMLSKGETVILKIEVQGAAKIRKLYPEAVSIFIMPPSLKALEQRLRGRESEDEEELSRRLFIADNEIRRAVEYDYIVVNDVLDRAVEDIDTIIKAERLKTSRNKNTISEVINNV